MEKYLEAHQLLILADKLLFYRNIVGCFEVCKEAERLAYHTDEKNQESVWRDYFLMKIGSIKRQLNSLMVNEVRKHFKKDISYYNYNKVNA